MIETLILLIHLCWTGSHFSPTVKRPSMREDNTHVRSNFAMFVYHFIFNEDLSMKCYFTNGDPSSSQQGIILFWKNRLTYIVTQEQHRVNSP